jgi:N-glycosylase/DNA lyase
LNRVFEIKRPQNFDIEQIFDCGQCFRFSASAKNNADTKIYEGVAFDRYKKIEQTPDRVTFYNTDKAEFSSVWHRFLDMDTDYKSIIDSFSDDKTLSEAAHFAYGIRILKQDKWEALCSFIISQNNNIPRIKGIIENMSAKLTAGFSFRPLLFRL